MATDKTAREVNLTLNRDATDEQVIAAFHAAKGPMVVPAPEGGMADHVFVSPYGAAGATNLRWLNQNNLRAHYRLHAVLDADTGLPVIVQGWTPPEREQRGRWVVLR